MFVQLAAMQHAMFATCPPLRAFNYMAAVGRHQYMEMCGVPANASTAQQLSFWYGSGGVSVNRSPAIDITRECDQAIGTCEDIKRILKRMGA